MRLTEILKPQNIKVPLEAKVKTDAIKELVNLLASNGDITDPKKVLDAVLEREATRTTGIGNGLAIPHGKCTGTSNLVMAIGKAATPIDFQAIDGRPVSLIWLLSSPPDKTGPHIHALARISRLMTIDKIRQALAAANTAQEIFDAIVQQENAREPSSRPSRGAPEAGALTGRACSPSPIAGSPSSAARVRASVSRHSGRARVP